MSQNRHKLISRPKAGPEEQEEAGAVVNLGDFQDVDTLTLSEASLVINALVAKRRKDGRGVNETEYVHPRFRSKRIVAKPRPGQSQ